MATQRTAVERASTKTSRISGSRQWKDVWFDVSNGQTASRQSHVGALSLEWNGTERK